MVRTKIKGIVPNLKERGAREEKKINMITEYKRRPLLSREEGIDFYPQWSTQQGVKEGEIIQEERGYDKSQGDVT